MNPFRHILVAVDFSAHADRAVEVAADLACRYEARLHIAHVYEGVPCVPLGSFELQMLERRSEVFAEMEQRLAACKSRAEAAGAQRVETHLRQGSPAEEITALARALGQDLIVMGTHGRNGLPHLLIGSVAERVLRLAPCAVLTVRLL